MNAHQFGRLSLSSVVVLAVARIASAQDVSSTIAITGGTTTDLAGTRSNAVTVSPSLAAAGTNSLFTLAASGTRFTTGAQSGVLSAGLSARANSSSFSPTIDVSASGATTSYAISYLTAELTPALQARMGSFLVFGGAHLGAATTTIRSAALPSFGGVGPASTTRVSHRGAAAMIGATISSIIETTGESVSLGYRGERGVVADETQTDNTLTTSVASGANAFSASVAHRAVAGAGLLYGSAALQVGVTPTVALRFGAGKYPTDRLLGTAAGQFATAGLSIRLGRSAPSMPQPDGVASVPRGMTRLALRAADATSVDVAGDFNHWNPQSTRRAGNGVWYVDLQIPPGEYRYAFRVNGKEWRVPAGVAAADDEFGGKSAWLIVNPAKGQSTTGSNQEDQ